MNQNRKRPFESFQDKPETRRKPFRAGAPISYRVGKMTFMVTPVFRDHTGKPMSEILMGLMKKDAKNH